MLKRLLYIHFIFLVLFVMISRGQNQHAKWYFGNMAGLDFMTNPPSTLTNTTMNAPNNSASIADATGNLLFYTSGTTIWNSQHNIMQNGTGLFGLAPLIVKQPGNTNIYYVFTQNTTPNTSMVYSEIDMSLAAGMGSVTAKNIPLVSGCNAALAGWTNCSGSVSWVLCHDYSGNNFYATNVSAAGVFSIAGVSPVGSSGFPGVGSHMRISPDGTRISLTLGNQIYLYDFNTATGAVSNEFPLGYTCPSGSEFSPDGTKLYARISYSGLFPDCIGQWDLCAGSNTAIASSLYTIAVPNSSNLRAMQVAPNGKIYIARQLQSFMSVINNPNAAGVACNYTDVGQSIAPKLNTSGITSFISGLYNHLSPLFTYTLSNVLGCKTASFAAPPSPCAAAGFSVTNLLWNFGDPTSGAANSSTLNNPVHVYNSMGTYTPQLILNYSCSGSSDTIRVPVSITGPSLSIGSSSITCASLGSATATAIGGIGAYSYTWMPGGQTSSVATSLNPGTYSLTLASNVGTCIYTTTASFTSPVPLTGSLNNTPSITCNAASTGTANYTNLAGGSANQNYLWTNGLLTYTAPNPVNLSAGTWSSVVTDALTGCTINNTFVITQPPALTLSILGNNNGACVTNSAAISGTASGGTPGYLYSWTGGPASNDYTVNVLSADATVFSLTATDSYSCSVTGTILINALPIPLVTQNSSVLCQGRAFVFSASGGASYNWSGPQFYSSSLATNTINLIPLNQAGVYNLTVTAANNCTASANLSLSVNPTPTLNATGGSACTTQTLNLIANSIPGAAFYWSGPLSFTSALQNVSIPMPTTNQAGAYTVMATSVSGCTNSTVVFGNVVLPPNLNAALSSNSTCAQALGGSPNTIVLNGSGASTYTLSTPSHIYNSNPSGPTSSLSLLPPFAPSGPATATLAGSNGVCTVTLTRTFSIVPNPTLGIVSPTPVICAGQTYTYTNSGASSYTWTSSNPGNYIYTTGSVVATSPTINSVFSVVGGSLGCNSAIQNSSITVNPLPVFSIMGNTNICVGSLAVLSAVGIGSSYTWSPAVYLNTNTNATVIASPPVPQTYVVISTLNSCTASAVVTVSVMPVPKAVISLPKPSVCLNEIMTLQGSGSYGYEWQGPNNFYSNQQNVSLIFNNLIYSGIYKLIVTDLNGCKGFTTAGISVNDLPSAILTGRLEGCAPFCTELILKTSASVNSTWSSNQQNMNSSVFDKCFTEPGIFNILGNLYDSQTTCSNTLTYQVKVNPKPKADFAFFPNKPVEGLDEVLFNDYSEGESIKQWQWFFINNNGYKSRGQNAKYLFETYGTYPVAMIVKNTWGCADSITKAITVEADFMVYVPNAFTPNGDGLNDFFLPKSRGVLNYGLQVFNRWGALIFESNDPMKGWDGSFNGEEVPIGVYSWKIYAKSTNEQRKDLFGAVNLSR